MFVKHIVHILFVAIIFITSPNSTSVDETETKKPVIDFANRGKNPFEQDITINLNIDLPDKKSEEKSVIKILDNDDDSLEIIEDEFF